jgi:hypothetical protein
LIRKAKVEIKDKIFLKVKSARIKWVHLTIFEDNHDDFLEILRDEFKSIHRGHLHWEIIIKIIKYDRDNKVRAWNHYGVIEKKNTIRKRSNINGYTDKKNNVSKLWWHLRTNKTWCHYFYRYSLTENIMPMNIEGITGGIQGMKRIEKVFPRQFLRQI